MRNITCFGDWTSGTFLIIALVSRTHNLVNVNVFNSVTSPRVLSYCCVLRLFLTMPVGFNLTFGLNTLIYFCE